MRTCAARRRAADPGRQRAQRDLPGAARRAPAREVERIILTASGGPFRDWSRRADGARDRWRRRAAHPELGHGPAHLDRQRHRCSTRRWKSSRREQLFDVEPDQIEVLVHPQSVVHSMVGFQRRLDHRAARSVRHARRHRLRAELAGARARCRSSGSTSPRSAGSTSRPADPERFPALRLAREVMALRRPRRRGVQRGQGGGARCFPRRAGRLP